MYDPILLEVFKSRFASIAEEMGMKEEYAYINPSIERFPTGAEQVKLSYAAGFSQAVHYPLLGGMMGILVITK